MGQASAISAFSAARLAGSGCAVNGVTAIQPPALSLIRTSGLRARPESNVCSAFRISSCKPRTNRLASSGRLSAS